MNLGFSTGIFWKSSVDAYSSKTIESMLELGCDAIEVSCLEAKFNRAWKLKREQLKNFKFISLHAPAVNFKYKNDVATKTILDEIRKLHASMSFDAVIIHPSSVTCWGVFNEYGDVPLCIENMDNRKETGKSFLEIKSLVKSTGLGILIDIQHCFSNDPTLLLAKELVNFYGKRIKGFHISGYKDDYHFPLYKTKQEEIIKQLPTKANVIMESPVKDLTQMKREYQYVTNKLRLFV